MLISSCLISLLGKPVKLSGRRLRQQCLPNGSESYHSRISVDGVLVGSAFACRWEQDGMNICWITQLVVDKEYRRRGFANGLLRSFRLETDDIYGIVSSHPAACLAASSAFGCKYDFLNFHHSK